MTEIKNKERVLATGEHVQEISGDASDAGYGSNEQNVNGEEPPRRFRSHVSFEPSIIATRLPYDGFRLPDDITKVDSKKPASFVRAVAAWRKFQLKKRAA